MRTISSPTTTAEGDKKQEESESGLWEEGRKDRGHPQRRTVVAVGPGKGQMVEESSVSWSHCHDM